MSLMNLKTENHIFFFQTDCHTRKPATDKTLFECVADNVQNYYATISSEENGESQPWHYQADDFSITDDMPESWMGDNLPDSPQYWMERDEWKDFKEKHKKPGYIIGMMILTLNHPTDGSESMKFIHMETEVAWE